MTDLKHTGSGNEYEEGRGPEGTEPSKNLKKKKDLFVLKTYFCEHSMKDILSKKLTGKRATTNERQDVGPSDGWSAHGRTTRS